MTAATLTPIAEAVGITLTSGQQQALEDFTAFLLNPAEPVFVICGYSGTGKTTLVRVLLQKVDAILKTIHLLNPDAIEYSVALTATTNKAAEAFSGLTQREVKTIHSFLGLRVSTDYQTRVTSLVPGKPNEIVTNTILFIDEASYIDSELLGLIFKMTHKCKIVFMGDPAQLSPVKSSTTPVFNANFPTAMLTQVVRQAEGNPIVELSTQFRETVSSGQWTNFRPDAHHVQHMSRELFEQAIVREFTRPDWKYHDSKILAWTNERVIDFNHAVRDCVKGSTDFQAGDYAVCNAYVSGGSGGKGFKTDEMVQITEISSEEEQYGVMGKMYTLNNRAELFGPNNLADWKAAEKRLKAEGQFSTLNNIDANWVDLRAAFACTVNKSQGSTFDRVYIDLDDIGRCRNANLVARMLYVGVSRARHQVFLTGDIS
jgi:hypothetical protein